MVKRISRRDSDKPRAESAEATAAAPLHPHPSRTKRAAARAKTAAAEGAARVARETHIDSLVHRGADALSGEAGGIAAAVAVGLGAALIEVELLPGILLGAAAVLVGRMLPQAEGGVRPLVRAAVGAGLTMADKARSLAAEAGEQVRDVVAEVRAERARATRPDLPPDREAVDASRPRASTTRH